MINYEVYEVIEEHFQSIKNRYQINLKSITGSQFVYNYVQLFFYKNHKINTYRGGSYKDSNDLKKKTKK